MSIQADGKIVVAGSTTSTTGGTTSKNIMLARVNANGQIDATFGASNADGTPDGVVSLSLGSGEDVANAMAIQVDGRIVLAGTTTSIDGTGIIAVARLNPDGSLDTYFGIGTADGTPDGVVSLSLGAGNDTAAAVAIQPNGKILVAGTTTAADTSTNIAVARLNANGSIDTSFGAGTSDGTPDGAVGISLDNGNDAAIGMVLQADGKIVVVGTTTASGASTNIAVARLNANGSMDSSFGAGTSDGTPDGAVGISLGAGNDFARGVALQADGKILIVGDRVNAGSSDIVLARLIAN